MTQEQKSKLAELSNAVKPVFLKWEKLRILYNFILFVVTVLWYAGAFSWGRSYLDPVLLLSLLVGAVLANLCFLAGPIAEAYIAWLGWRSTLVTITLFVGGVVISIPCVIFFVPLGPMMHGF